MHPRAVAYPHHPSLDTELRLKLLRVLEQHPELSQRQIARELGVSLGKTNYCLKALAEKGWIKMANFGRSTQKHRYIYQLTPGGVSAKLKLTQRFLARKISEHEALTAEIQRLRLEVESEQANRNPGQAS
ncbi:MAG: MarR family EPS-associated transcriptional regulator [Wenzhouxiangella sp.]